ncbi:hypothetical protein [Allokutzneria oryzae]|uniref:LppX_LprAFG lipoprotein n=1 Tax=Allokutzneria oryzae TaxID=1378989 RepID=A0ABV5ZYQ8_9PSEU
MRRTTILAISGLALVGVLTACGSAQQGEPVPAAGSDQAAPTTGASGGGGATAPSGPLEQLVTKAGAAMAAKKTAKITVSASGAPAADGMGGSGVIRLDGNEVALSMTSKMAGEPGQPAQETKMIVVGGAMYVEAPKDMPVEPGKKWVKIDPNGTDVMSKLLGVVVRQVRQSADPKNMFKTFTDAGTLNGSSPDTLDGVATTKHKLAVDLRKMSEKATDPLTKLSYEALLKNGVTTMDYDFWTDAQDLPKQFQFTQRMPGSDAGITMVAKYSAWGEPVDIKAPAESEIAPPVELPQPTR